jgi:hypothetical protein
MSRTSPRLWLAATLAAFFPAFPGARPAGVLDLRPGTPPVPRGIRLALRRRPARQGERHARQRTLRWLAMACWTRVISVILVDLRWRASHSTIGTFRPTDNASWTSAAVCGNSP